MKNAWKTSQIAISRLHLDAKNPRLGNARSTMSPRDIINRLFQLDKAGDVAESIARSGYFANEPLLAVQEGSKLIIVEGNRRLAALKALADPTLTDGPWPKKLTKLVKDMGGTDDIQSVPVTIAPSRRETDRQVASRHIGTPVLPWEAENRAGFILAKLAEGYSTHQLRSELGFTDSDIQKARIARAIADMARSLDLPATVKGKIDNPRAQVFSTIERVLLSAPGREFFRLEPSLDHGIKGRTSKDSFSPAFSKLVSDVALKKKSSRSLNTATEISNYLKEFPDDLKPKRNGSFTPDEFRTKALSVTHDSHAEPPTKREKGVFKTVLPRSVKVSFDHEKLADMRSELVKLRRAAFPNASAFLLRAFFEIAAVEYLRRTGELQPLINDLRAQGRLQGETPTLKQIVSLLKQHAKRHLSSSQADSVEKAINYNRTAPFTISDLHSFVHQSNELPTERDVLQFWKRVEPLVRHMLQADVETAADKTRGRP